MIEATFVGGPYDGAVWALDGLGPVKVLRPPVRPAPVQIRADAGLVVPYVELYPVNTALGWRLFWPRGAS